MSEVQNSSPARPRSRLNVPMALTWTRVALIPFVIGVFYLGCLSPHAQNVIACVIFCIAAITDALDGFIARHFNLTTPMGAFLDSVADKLLVCAAVIALLALRRIDMLVALIIVGREIAVTGLREWMAKVGASSHVKVNWYGKVKAIAQMVAIPMLLWHDPLWGLNIPLIGTWLIWIAVILTLYSMCVYTKAAIPFLYPDEKLKNQDR
ncbi:CDP-diacylglycerol--glycerol-3-phosphate 3-phosphatidyltransferase [Mesosutterella sp. AGMB02718]|uniref:CDP-diacylglycerol--glycerol-3-phosphate 3-phosphatidyltransferase n=1 Tax=Mesosutterella faecium TaxID=2925194 RepID=A0ABT7ILT4_9BURK|nr:CDP-diacylglycerol--glycerol-3-phosphate 3-phosphatidyltransferase [Mesosutterella sp. AGMB02718]MDL2059314.1 CDP-diacylglycerol--glycerol-3-phosphate 3-phosphatidyltransferase [Mesosutterella sp. AGMB02718]